MRWGLPDIAAEIYPRTPRRNKWRTSTRRSSDCQPTRMTFGLALPDSSFVVTAQAAESRKKGEGAAWIQKRCQARCGRQERCILTSRPGLIKSVRWG